MGNMKLKHGLQEQEHENSQWSDLDGFKVKERKKRELVCFT